MSFNSSDVIIPCLQSLIESSHQALRIVVVDNASPDNTIELIERWAGQLVESGRLSFDIITSNEKEFPNDAKAHSVTIFRNHRNSGYAGACNIGFQLLYCNSKILNYWILNPDCVVLPDTAINAQKAIDKNPEYSLMGGRINFTEPANSIQSDGGQVNMWTGRCRNIHQGLPQDSTPYPELSEIDYCPGAHFFVSRTFYEMTGGMQDDYFLYFEEIDWAFRRGELPLQYCHHSEVFHQGGTSIGSRTMYNRASAFSNYFNFRNRILFLIRFHPLGIPTAYAYSMALIARLCLYRAWDEAYGAFCGLHQLPPPKNIKKRLQQTNATFLKNAFVET
ncbi:glycosyltransferase family 2 protein [Thalassoglobus sp. JC818]|uniref:glycosyltransferase family 2 protein n=1 Tax=Thalassoglobus sp. JC818 TaxID=3232136 RepID=UPI0034591CDB